MVSAFEPSPVAGYTPIWDSIKQGQDYANSVFQLAQKKNQYQASLNAGQKFAAGDYAGAASAQALGGDTHGAEETQNFGAQRFMIEHQYLGQAATVLQGVYDQHGGGQQGTQAVVSAFGQLAPDLKQFGMSDQQISQLGASLAQDTQGALKAASAFAAKQPTITKDDAGNLIVTDQFGNLMHTIPGQQKPIPVPYGTRGFYTPPSGSAGDALFGNQPAPPGAVQQVESGGNPNAVSPAGAVGTMQTEPGTLQSPGYGVQPAANNTAFEQTRVGQDYLAAMQQHYGSPTLGLIAYNMGPGRTDEWLKNGGQFKDLPKETQAYLGQVAVQSAVQQRGGATQPQSGSGPTTSALPNGGSFTDFGGGGGSAPVQPITPGSPEAKNWPGASGIDRRTGHPIYPTSAAITAQNIGSLPQIIKDNPNAHGDDFLKLLPPNQAAEVKAFAEGRGPQFSAMAMRSPAMKPLLDAVYQYNPNFDNSSVGRRAKTMNAFATGKEGQEVTAISTAIQHMNTLRQLANALGNGNVQLLNAARQSWEQQTGSPVPTNFDALKTAVGNEISKVTAGGIGTGEDRSKVQGPLSRASSPQQLQGVMNTYTQLIAGRLAARQRQYEFNTGNKDFPSMLTPDAQQALSGVLKGGNKPSQKPSKVVNWNDLK